MKVDIESFHDKMTAFLLLELKKRKIPMPIFEQAEGIGTEGRVLRRAKYRKDSPRRWTVAELINIANLFNEETSVLITRIINFITFTPDSRIQEILAKNWKEFKKEEE